MEDKTTPHLGLEEQGAILSGSEFLTGREAHLQARLDELERELGDLKDVPDDIESLEQQALDALRTLSDLLEPPTPVPATTPSPEPMPAFLPAIQSVNHRKPWRVAGIVVVLLAVALSAFSLIWIFGPELVGDNSPATAIAQVTATHTPMLPTSTTVSPTQPPVTATPIPSPTIAAPAILETPGQDRKAIQADMVQILDVSGTLRLELPLSLMANTIQVVEAMPVLQPVLPANGAGVHRGSVPFGKVGMVMVAIPARSAPASLWQTRPGERLVGCNTDGACHEYRIVLAETWPLDQVRQILTGWPLDGGVLVYTVADETSAWVIQAQPLHQEGTR